MTELRTAWATAGRTSRKFCRTAKAQVLTSSRCDCPPDLGTFVSAVGDFVAGGAAFPSGQSRPRLSQVRLLITATGNSAADQLTRLQTCIVTLQNFKGGPGSGVGCPAVSTTWKELQAQLQSEVK
jgi:hypothetical protein